MVRLTYISKKQAYITDHDICTIVSAAADNNKKNGITGMLICYGDVFFQILEGEEKAVLQLFEDKIKKDSRHTNVIKINQELVSSRKYQNSSLKMVNLNDTKETMYDPFGSVLKSLSEKFTRTNGSASLNHQNTNGVHKKSSEIVDKIVLFCDIVSFSALSENLKPHLVIELLNQYMDVVTKNIISTGGHVSKLLGDGVMAYFDIDEGDNAMESCLGILSDLQEVRRKASDGSPEKVLYTGIGMASGPVIEGHMGSEVKKDFTIIGDSVNLASRLESMTRSQKVSLLFSKEVKDNLKLNWDITEMGRHIIKGKKEPFVLYSIRSPFTQKTSTGIELEWEIRNGTG